CAAGELAKCHTWHDVLQPDPYPRRPVDGRARWTRFDAFATSQCTDPSRGWMCLEAVRHAAWEGRVDELARLLDAACGEGWSWGGRRALRAGGLAAPRQRFDLAERCLEKACPPETRTDTTENDCLEAGETAQRYFQLKHLSQSLWTRSCVTYGKK